MCINSIVSNNIFRISLIASAIGIKGLTIKSEHSHSNSNSNRNSNSNNSNSNRNSNSNSNRNSNNYINHILGPF